MPSVTSVNIEWYLCDKYAKRKHNFKLSYETFLKTQFTAHGIFMSQKVSVQCSSYHFSGSSFFPKQLYDLSSPRLIGPDIVTKKLNFNIQNVMYAFVLNDCCISYKVFITRQLQ